MPAFFVGIIKIRIKKRVKEKGLNMKKCYCLRNLGEKEP
jgi:hypothetical protein